MRGRRHGLGDGDRGSRLTIDADTSATTGAVARSRLGFLDAARGIAAVAVVVQHSGESLWPAFARTTREVFNPGWFGVVVFFLTSGFIIPASLERLGDERLRNQRGAALRRFWVGRFFRLYPLYWVSLVGILLVSLYEPRALTDEFRAELARNSIVGATMVQELVGVPHAIGLYYTLTLELLFYAACTLLFALGLLRSSVRNAAIVIGGALVVACLVPLVAEVDVPIAALFYASSMFLGSVAYRWTTGEATTRDLAVLAGAAAVLGLAGAWLNDAHFRAATDGAGPFSWGAATRPWAAAYVCFFALLVVRERSMPRWLLWLGTISYSLYLIHPLFVGALAHWEAEWLALGLIVVGSLCVAPVTYRWVEVPAQRAGRRLRSRVGSPR